MLTEIFLCRRAAAARQPFRIDTPGLTQPRTLRLLLPRGKSNQKRAKTYGSGLPPRTRLTARDLGEGVAIVRWW